MSNEQKQSDAKVHPVDTLVMPIDVGWELLEVVHIDALVRVCGMFDPDSDLNNGYGCRSTHNTESPGRCYTFSCPIATEIDNEDPEWNDSLSEATWMRVHSKFATA